MEDTDGSEDRRIEIHAVEERKRRQSIDHVRTIRADFEKFMAVIWMIILYPEVHKYTLAQRREITEYMYESFWVKKKPL